MGIFVEEGVGGVDEVEGDVALEKVWEEFGLLVEMVMGGVGVEEVLEGVDGGRG